jgi:hypothetical protein
VKKKKKKKRMTEERVRGFPHEKMENNRYIN